MSILNGRAQFALALLGMLAVGGCMGSLSKAQSTCNTGNSTYLETWGCIRGKVAANEAGLMNNDLGVHYLAVGDALADRVKARQLSDADAKLALADELRSANREFQARVAMATSGSDEMLETGARLLAPPPIVSQPSMFSPPVACTSRRVGYTVQTTC